MPDHLSRLRLLVVFDALLREGSVAKAATSLGLQSSAVSRMLGQLREFYGDPLFKRTTKGLTPTPFAESLRLRLRALAEETENLFNLNAPARSPLPSQAASGWERPLLIDAPALAARPSVLLVGQPTPADLAFKLASIGSNAAPRSRLAKYIAISSSGPGQTRPLTLDEAEDALAIILAGEADPVQIGALFVAMQHRGVAAAELAGFVKALREHIGARDVSEGQADLDWPAYVSPKLKWTPWLIHSARLVADAGFRVVLHGYHGLGDEAGKLEAAAEMAGIPICASIAQAETALSGRSIAYLPVAALSPQIQNLLALHSMFEMRLPQHAVAPLLNPLGAKSSIFGVTTQSKRDLLRDVAALIDMNDISIIGSTRDVAEFTPFKSTTLFRLIGGLPQDTHIEAQRSVVVPTPPSAYTNRDYWHAIWTGAARDEAAEAIIVDTVAVALLTIPTCSIDTFESARHEAAALWRSRTKR